jgi:hypothetical protein
MSRNSPRVINSGYALAAIKFAVGAEIGPSNPESRFRGLSAGTAVLLLFLSSVWKFGAGSDGSRRSLKRASEGERDEFERHP